MRGLTDAALIGRAVMNVFQDGSGLESAADRASFAAGLRHVAADPSTIVTRVALVNELAALLAQRGVAVVQPAGAHAVFVEVPKPLLARFGPLVPPVLLAQVFATAGLRGRPVKWGEQLCLRFALPTVRVQAAALPTIADAIECATKQLGDARALPPAARAGPRAAVRAPLSELAFEFFHGQFHARFLRVATGFRHASVEGERV